MKKKKQGFTLIELLAVIVILGLLMAIAIPSVTKYITQSRKKTLTTTIGNYTSALVTDVNNLEYVFTETNTIYAVPVECVEVERGGSNPFGEWSPATENHWAYVLVQYDDTTSSYIYGFTFKDSAGYGLYPITLEELNENGSQIQTDLDFGVAKSGGYEIWTDAENWENSGFKINEDTVVVTLEKNSNETCSIRKACKVTSGTGNNIGDVITCGEEDFYVISNNGTTLNMFAKYRLDFNKNRQNVNSKTSTYFSTKGSYWIENGDLKKEYGASYPAYVYDENCNLYNGIKEYNDYLRDELNVSSAKSRLITLDELVNLGCNLTDRYCTNAPSWVNSTYYWTGTTGGEYVWGTYDGRMFSYPSGVAHGVRTVLTVATYEIDFG